MATGVLRRGDFGEPVRAWQAALNDAARVSIGLVEDGRFGARTELATKAFQAAHGLPADGIVGARTRARMDAVHAVPVSRLDAVLAHVLASEGGYVNHPADPGGATNRGVTQRVYDGWRRALGQPTRSVRRIADDEVERIYVEQYWRPIRGADLPRGIDLCTFDAAVNSGVSRGAKWLQRAVGVAADGIVGLVTLDAARSQPAARTINRMCDDRLAFLRRLPTWRVFGTGWSRRVARVRASALADVA